MTRYAAHDGQTILGTGPTPRDAINDALDGHPRDDNGDGLQTAIMAPRLAELVKEGGSPAFVTLIPDDSGNEGLIGTAQEAEAALQVLREALPHETEENIRYAAFRIMRLIITGPA